MTTLIIVAIVLVGGWIAFRIFIRKVKARKVGGISKDEAMQFEAHMPREQLAATRAAAKKKVDDLRLRKLEEFYFFEEINRD